MPRAATPPAMKDALLAAVIAKLPSPGTAWPANEREAWFTMMRHATDVAYGPVERVILPYNEEVLQADQRLRTWLSDGEECTATIAKPIPRRFYVDREGFAMCDGRPIDQVDLPATGIMWDERSGIDLGEPTAIMWKTAGTSKTPLPLGVQLRPAEVRHANGQVTT